MPLGGQVTVPPHHVRLRPGRREDAGAIQQLYQTVAATPGGIARTPAEVTREYVKDFVAHSLQRGVLLVAELPGLPGLTGELHAYRSDLQAFAHVLGDLTVAVHPQAQGRGIGRQLFTQLLDVVTREHPDITRVELIAQESNHRALTLYESVGFRREGRLEGRIRRPGGGVEADIPLAWHRRRQSGA
jgi:ribosomal protein S18 acetylase RimI-like enzyme